MVACRQTGQVDQESFRIIYAILLGLHGEGDSSLAQRWAAKFSGPGYTKDAIEVNLDFRWVKDCGESILDLAVTSKVS